MSPVPDELEATKREVEIQPQPKAFNQNITANESEMEKGEPRDWGHGLGGEELSRTRGKLGNRSATKKETNRRGKEENRTPKVQNKEGRTAPGRKQHHRAWGIPGKFPYGT